MIGFNMEGDILGYLEGKINELIERIKAMETENKGLREEINALNAELASRKERINELEQKKEEAKGRIMSILDKISLLESGDNALSQDNNAPSDDHNNELSVSESNVAEGYEGYAWQGDGSNDQDAGNSNDINAGEG